MASAAITGDLRRTTFVVDTQEELDAIAAAIPKTFAANMAKKVDKFQGTISDQLQTIHDMEKLELATKGKVIVYRFKQNSSQKGKEKCKLYNMV